MKAALMEQKPSIGRIVHYKAHGSPNGQHLSEPRAAMVTKVHNDTCVDLCVFNPSGLFFNQSCIFGEGPGQWSWPTRI